MKASGTLLWLYLFMYHNGSHKVSKEHGPIGSNMQVVGILSVLGWFFWLLFYLNINLV